jgi:hypothetical protein
MNNEEIYLILHKKYDKLIHSISWKISGDEAINSNNDNYQNLWLAAFEAVEGFRRQNNFSNGPVESWIDTKAFDKYLKTCLWNCKNSQGQKIKKKWAIRPAFSIKDDILDLEETLVAKTSSDETYKDFANALVFDERHWLDCLLRDPNRYLTAKGKVKILPMQKELGWSHARTSEAARSVGSKMRTYGISNREEESC